MKKINIEASGTSLVNRRKDFLLKKKLQQGESCEYVRPDEKIAIE